MTLSVPTTVPQEAFERSLGRQLIARREFVDAVGAAVRDRRGYAAGKLGVSERAWMYYPVFLARGPSRLQARAFEQSLYYKCTPTSGVFPADPSFYREFADFYGRRLRELDCLGLDPAAFDVSLEILRFHSVDADVIDYMEQEPDRSIPADEDRCYLPHFAGKRILLICPFANVLAERAQRATFEAVWAKTGKRWFEPASVEALEFPYGFAKTTQARYGTCLELLTEIEGHVDALDYDVALIAAGALGVPIASHVRSRGRVGISLGGALQVLFGVYGKRWKQRPDWRDQYFTPAWIEVPAQYRPDISETHEGYW